MGNGRRSGNSLAMPNGILLAIFSDESKPNGENIFMEIIFSHWTNSATGAINKPFQTIPWRLGTFPKF